MCVKETNCLFPQLTDTRKAGRLYKNKVAKYAEALCQQRRGTFASLAQTLRKNTCIFDLYVFINHFLVWESNYITSELNVQSLVYVYYQKQRVKHTIMISCLLLFMKCSFDLLTLQIFELQMDFYVSRGLYNAQFCDFTVERKLIFINFATY